MISPGLYYIRPIHKQSCAYWFFEIGYLAIHILLSSVQYYYLNAENLLFIKYFFLYWFFIFTSPFTSSVHFISNLKLLIVIFINAYQTKVHKRNIMFIISSFSRFLVKQIFEVYWQIYVHTSRWAKIFLRKINKDYK
jgi:hypothetical protein